MVRSRGVRIALPAAAILLLTWLMVGCVYIPWFETAKLTGTARDFRPMAGDLVRYRATKEAVRRLLGEPVARSGNDRVWAYTLGTSHGVWIEPLCFHAPPGDLHYYGLDLQFNESGLVERQHVVKMDVASNIAGGNEGLGQGSNWPDRRQDLLQKIDRDNGVPRRDYVGEDLGPGATGPRAFAVWHLP